MRPEGEPRRRKPWRAGEETAAAEGVGGGGSGMILWRLAQPQGEESWTAYGEKKGRKG